MQSPIRPISPVRAVPTAIDWLVVALAAVLVAALLALVPSVSPRAEAVAYKPWGRVTAPDQPLLTGCHRYVYRYRIHPPSEDWLLEIFLVSPTGQPLAHEVYDGAFDPNRARRKWTLCKASTTYGRHKLRAKITWTEDDVDLTSHVGWLRPRYFRLYRP